MAVQRNAGRIRPSLRVLRRFGKEVKVFIIANWTHEIGIEMKDQTHEHAQWWPGNEENVYNRGNRFTISMSWINIMFIFHGSFICAMAGVRTLLRKPNSSCSAIEVSNNPFIVPL